MGSTLEVIKLLYEAEHANDGNILGVRPKNTCEIPCILTRNETKLEHGEYDIIVKGKIIFSIQKLKSRFSTLQPYFWNVDCYVNCFFSSKPLKNKISHFPE